MDIKEESVDADPIVECLIDIKEEPFELDLKDECEINIKEELSGSKESEAKDESIVNIKEEAVDVDSGDECLIDIPTRIQSEDPDTDPLEQVETKNEIVEADNESSSSVNQDYMRYQESGDMQHGTLSNKEIGNKKFKCDYCPNTFNKESDLQVHLRTKCGKDPFLCDRCISSFHTKSLFQNHTTLHKVEDLYVNYVRLSIISRLHQKKMRIHVGETI
uniref:C2H2-type domain-containing protein n=1 Tax=Clastoptera arizonana TaxID=38151 RepID=A0A1B6CMD8_9HEMI